MAAFEAIDDARQAREEAEASARRPGLSPLTAARLKCKAEQLRAVERSLPRPRPPTDSLTYPQGRLAVWAQGVIWNSENPLDCYPEQPSTAADPPSREANVPFFEEWAERLGWTDFDMIHQIASGVDSRSSCELATVLRFHHKGFQKLFSPARASIDKDLCPRPPMDLRRAAALDLRAKPAYRTKRSGAARMAHARRPSREGAQIPRNDRR